MGGLARISLFIDDEEKLKLKNNEEQMIVTDKDSIVIQAKQLLFASKPMQLHRDEYVEIKLSQIYLSLFWIAIFCLFISMMIYDKLLKFIFAAVGLIIMIIATVYGSNRCFILEKTNREDR